MLMNPAEVQKKTKQLVVGHFKILADLVPEGTLLLLALVTANLHQGSNFKLNDINTLLASPCESSITPGLTILPKPTCLLNQLTLPLKARAIFNEIPLQPSS